MNNTNEFNALTAKDTEEKGASLIEYSLLAALVAMAVVTSIVLIGEEASQSFSLVGSGFTPNS